MYVKPHFYAFYAMFLIQSAFQVIHVISMYPVIKPITFALLKQSTWHPFNTLETP